MALCAGISRMEALRTLHEPFITDMENLKGLGDLKNLRELKLYLTGFTIEFKDVVLSSLCRLGNLQSLTISGFNLEDNLLTCWSPPPCHLRRLHVLSCPFSFVPDWIVQLENLKSLEIHLVSLPRDGVEVLANLISLVHLTLRVRGHALEEDVVVVVRGAMFPNLKNLVFIYEVPCLMFEAGAMPRLQNLSIECCAQAVRHAVGVLDGIEHLRSLKACKVDIYDRADRSGQYQPYCALNAKRAEEAPHVQEEDVGRWNVQSLQAAFKMAINKHPGNLNVLFARTQDPDSNVILRKKP